ncbi:hypothetical protein A2688_02605 [Candidatus Daviesbacteria bacterium RIFCSPHIGHO2_01_FULL_38_8]|nr:MAG: hypothetical protein A2688_02605 [Candidatus Daviesbacteria bacterium RIFCSPHIGHO2_01_FULL_38_8]
MIPASTKAEKRLAQKSFFPQISQPTKISSVIEWKSSRIFAGAKVSIQSGIYHCQSSGEIKAEIEAYKKIKIKPKRRSKEVSFNLSIH